MRNFIKFGTPNFQLQIVCYYMEFKKMVDVDINDQQYVCSIGDEELEESAKSLLQLEVNQKGIIVLIAGGRTACKRLNEMGLVPGVEIELVNRINSGPVMIKVKGSKLALGRGLAAKVMVV